MFGRKQSGSSLTVEDIKSVFYICPLSNLSNIFERGIMSHNAARRVTGHEDISDREVQTRRAAKKISNRPLHDHVNFYLNPHNAMFFARRESNICILELKGVTDLTGVRLTRINASIGHSTESWTANEYRMSPDSTRAATSPRSLAWGWEEPWDSAARKKRMNVRQAECLVPADSVSADHIVRVFVKNNFDRDTAIDSGARSISVQVKDRMFKPLSRISPISDITHDMPTSSAIAFTRSHMEDSRRPTPRRAHESDAHESLLANQP